MPAFIYETVNFTKFFTFSGEFAKDSGDSFVGLEWPSAGYAHAISYEIKHNRVIAAATLIHSFILLHVVHIIALLQHYIFSLLTLMCYYYTNKRENCQFIILTILCLNHFLIFLVF